MFLQNILQQRLKSLNEEEDRYLSSGQGQGSIMAGAGQNILGGNTYHGGFTKTIGSIKNRQVNYLPEHTFFNSQTHTKPVANETKKVVQNEIDKDLLGTKASKWNQSVLLPPQNPHNMGGDFHKDLEQSHQKFQIRHGFKDENITREDPQTTYAGCDTRDVYYHGWDVSHETTPPRDKERQYQIERAFLLDKTTRQSDRFLQSAEGVERTVYGINTNKYIRPMQITSSINQKLRSEKDQDVELWAKLLEQARFNLPGASQEKLNSLVYKQIQEMKHGKKEEHDPELTFKPNVTMSQMSKAPAPEKPKRRGFRGGANGTSSYRTTMKSSGQPAQASAKDGAESDSSKE